VAAVVVVVLVDPLDCSPNFPTNKLHVASDIGDHHNNYYNSLIWQQTERCCANRNERCGNNIQELYKSVNSIIIIIIISQMSCLVR